MPSRKVFLREKLIFAFLFVVLTSLFLSVSFSYSLFVLSLNKKVDPQFEQYNQLIKSRLEDSKQRTLIYADILSRNSSLILYLEGQASITETQQALKRDKERMDISTVSAVDSNGKRLLNSDNLDIPVANFSKEPRSASYLAINNKSYLVASAPIVKNGVVLGTVFAITEINSTFLDQIKYSIPLEISFFDTQGRLLGTTLKSDRGDQILDQKIQDASVAQLQTAKATSEIKEIGDFKYKLQYTPLTDTSGRLLAIEMTAFPLRPILADNTLTIIALLCANLFTVLLAYIIALKSSKKLVDPILTIREGAEIIAKGILQHKIKVQTNDEVEDLANSFNSMSTKLKGLLDQVSKERDNASNERNKFQLVIESVQDGIFTLDLNRKVTFFNKAAENITGLAQSDVIGKKCDEVLLLFKNNARLASSEFCPLTPVTKDQTVFSEKNIKLVTAKRELFVSLTSSTTKDAQTSNLGCIVTFRDSTKDKETEQLRLDFVSMAAHELRAPLTTIRGYLSVLQPRLAEKTNDDEKKYLGRIDISTNELLNLVENLLDVSKIDRNALELDIKPEDLTEITSSVVQNFEELARQKKIELKFNPGEKLPPAAIDKFRIGEVLSNLLSNALNNTDEDGIVEIKLSKDGDMIKASVIDTGHGIAEKELPHLFTKFYRASGSLESGAKGTGLGLYISKTIITLHKGEIWVESKLGEGSTFAFTVPVFSGKENTPKSVTRKI